MSKKGITFFGDLQRYGLIKLPPEIRLLRDLRALVLSDNKITDIPSDIGSLYNLETLYIV
jgi:Leucine-rich repeat (LRR) protein